MPHEYQPLFRPMPDRSKNTGFPEVKPEPLEPVANYYPFSNGRYEVTPGLSRLTRSFGNSEADSRILQIDRLYDEYRKQKLVARQDDLDKYICKGTLTERQETRINEFLINNMVTEYPSYFRLVSEPKRLALVNHLSGDRIYLDRAYRFIAADDNDSSLHPPYQSGMDALICQLQEDFCVLTIEDGISRLQFAHVCFPNNWLAREKIGQDFMALHNPVSEFEQANPRGHKIISALLKGGPYIRFAWGLSNDNHLRHLPGLNSTVCFSTNGDPLYVRVERQVLQGIPDIGCVLFFIRTYYYDCLWIKRRPDLCESLQSALMDMNTGALMYKGLKESRDSIVDWLRG